MILDVILPGVLLLGILVFLHEAGHFLVAKLLKVPVFRFSLGFGTALAQFKRRFGARSQGTLALRQVFDQEGFTRACAAAGVDAASAGRFPPWRGA